MKALFLGCGEQSEDLEVFVGNETPDTSSSPIDAGKYKLCGKLPYKMPETNAINGITCDRWLVGRYVIVQNNKVALDAMLDSKFCLQIFERLSAHQIFLNFQIHFSFLQIKKPYARG